jgi:hypothetical protein
LRLAIPLCSAEPASSADGRESIKPAEIASISAKEQRRTAQEERITKPFIAVFRVGAELKWLQESAEDLPSDGEQKNRD